MRIIHKKISHGLPPRGTFFAILSYPEALEKLIIEHGFTILNRWGVYEGEVYGQGPELVIQFGADH